MVINRFNGFVYAITAFFADQELAIEFNLCFKFDLRDALDIRHFLNEATGVLISRFDCRPFLVYVIANEHACLFVYSKLH